MCEFNRTDHILATQVAIDALFPIRKSVRLCPISHAPLACEGDERQTGSEVSMTVKCRIRLRTLTIPVVLLLTCAPNGYGYYDDVHYGLTYVIARMVGYTPDQAYRIASACVSIDYDSPTEPVQLSGALIGTTGLTIDEPPRWKFHAFRDEARFPLAAGPGQPAADRAVLQQRIKLYDMGFDEKNPGVYLHFYQDEVPHRGYTSNGGHWFRQTLFCSPITTALVLSSCSLPLGGTADWLSFRYENSLNNDPDVKTGKKPDANLELVQNTARTLSDIMTRMSNGKQKPRSFPAVGSPEYKSLVSGLLNELRKNTYPAPFAANEAWTVAITKMLIQGGVIDWDKYDPATREKMQKHLNGPDQELAYKAVNAALVAAGMPGPLPKERISYSFDGEGKFKGSKDTWVIFAHLNVAIDGVLLAVNKETQPEVLLKVAPARTSDAEIVLAHVAVNEKAAQVSFDDVPVGKVTVELRAGGKLLARTEEVDVLQENNEACLSGNLWGCHPSKTLFSQVTR
jgi:hypothetical protein